MREVLVARMPARPPIAKAAVSHPKRRCWNLVGSGAWAQVPAFDVEWEEGRVPRERGAAGLAPCPGHRSPRMGLQSSHKQGHCGAIFSCCEILISEVMLFNSRICIGFSLAVSVSLLRSSICSCTLSLQTLDMLPGRGFHGVNTLLLLRPGFPEVPRDGLTSWSQRAW